jgi:hypothetical protein
MEQTGSGEGIWWSHAVGSCFDVVASLKFSSPYNDTGEMIAPSGPGYGGYGLALALA